ncbi:MULTISPECIES: hypothetical protein [unclassified Mesorhizobium]|uniref:hypothetical protein n=1 Tax=unclassified Mesorhizobium TaxID=325217 RepID=UPI001127B4E1|nr:MULTISPECIES: hypothetical protein [unclassified Mesorhizobium]TPK64736.1 hypothetical protein FJ551_09325 [Mesorhizobium sp. B2-5-1]TPM66916.1 hypothetical protein FJ962_02765 [Mesorhizobium sp. B2-1-9]TPM88780.1 hypothetical protein FJ963_00610 [Mesorhizobium sp. B2-1-4]TPN08390.1 hypothetical protein FJ971_20285 [Mesorhizobium sp. B2-1-2]UCI14144.1 DUF2441 domain-containing protein [Mesorhizobium sp. B2-1-1]
MKELRGESYWHVTDRGGILLHNVRIGKGWCASISYFAKGELADAFTPYSQLAGGSDKERVWESVRATHFPDLPSRQKALFVFPSKENAERAIQEWYTGQDKVIVEVRLSMDVKLHIADARHLDHLPSLWPDATMRYWQGAITDNPRPEALVEGVVYFPGWEHEPFELMLSR